MSTTFTDTPASQDPYAHYRELTLRGMLLGALITVVFTASNVYLGLKVGLTFASSIPAAVISMALLRFARGSNILENNMVQTQASAAGTLSSVIFVIPGLLMAGYWHGFPFWQTVLICLAGGILGVIFTVPLRYAMVVKSSLPYPEGVAAAEILKAGSGEHPDEEGAPPSTAAQPGASRTAETGIREIAVGGLLAGVISFCTNGLRILSDSTGYWFKAGQAIFQLPMGFSLALLGAGYLVELSGGIAILVGIAIAWGGAVPWFSSHMPQPADMDMATFALKIWKDQVRFIGAGTIGIAAIWTLLTLLKPMIEGVRLSFRNFGSADLPPSQRIEQDLSPRAMILWTLGALLLLGLSFHHFIDGAHISSGIAWTLVGLCTLLTFVIGFLVAASCGYMAGLVGSSSSPISSVGIVSVIIISLVLLAMAESAHLFADEANRRLMLALTLFCGSAIISVASISNDNLQDLKTGHLVKATPWRQQVALIIGCLIGAVVIAPVLEMLYQAYGFTGTLPRPGMDMSQALAAPQATLMTTIAEGIFSHSLQWNYICTGIIIGVILIAIDLLLKRFSRGRKVSLSLPILAVGMGIYLPPAVNMPIVLGALLSALLRRRIRARHGEASSAQKQADRTGTLFAAGLIVGESLVGVVLAFVVGFSVTNGGSDAPLALPLQNWDDNAARLGLLAFAAGALVLAWRVLKRAR